jgi:hypothetical protein
VGGAVDEGDEVRALEEVVEVAGDELAVLPPDHFIE